MLRLRDELGEKTFSHYKRAISFYLAGRISKAEFDHAMLSWITTPERQSLHNEYVLAIETCIIEGRVQDEQAGSNDRTADEHCKPAMPSIRPGDVRLTTTEQKLVNEAGRRPALLHSLRRLPTLRSIPRGLSVDEFARTMCPSREVDKAPSSSQWNDRLRIYCLAADITPPSDDTAARLLWLASRQRLSRGEP